MYKLKALINLSSNFNNNKWITIIKHDTYKNYVYVTYAKVN